MVTIHDLSWEDDRLLELFGMLGSEKQGRLMRDASIAARNVVPLRTQDWPAGVADTPEAVTLEALKRCRPPLPSGWASDTDFNSLVEGAVVSRLGERALDMVLTTEEHDEHNARILVDLADEQARYFAREYDAPSFEDGYVSVDVMRKFIDDWRESFMANLRRDVAGLAKQGSVPNAAEERS